MNNIEKDIAKSFEVFGRTPLGERTQDILKEAIDLSRFTDVNNLKEETGDLLCSTIQLCNECGWSIEELVKVSLNKIERRKSQYKALGRKLEIALLGGAFDPITVGHIKLAQFVLNSSKTFDEVWIAPCWGHMYNKKLTDARHRLAMCYIAAEIDPRIKVLDYEIKHELRGETYHLIKQLKEAPEYRDTANFSAIIGMDNANSFDKWVNSVELERMVRFVVATRQGIPRNEKVGWYLKHPHMYLVAEDKIPDISSTVVRACLRRFFDKDLPLTELEPMRLEILKHMSQKEFDYIISNDLYRP